MSLVNSIHLEGEVSKAPESANTGDGRTGYRFVLKVKNEDGDAPKEYEYIDVFAIGSDDYDPWADVRKGLRIAVDGELRQDEGGQWRVEGKAVRLASEPKWFKADDRNDVKMVVGKEKEDRALRDIVGED